MALCNTSLERVFVLSLAMLFSIITFLIIAIVIMSELSYHTQIRKGIINDVDGPPTTFNSSTNATSLLPTCFTRECLLASSKILKFMDASVDPCDDFFQYACGGFEKSTILPDNIAIVTIVELSDYQMILELNESLDQPIDPQEPRYVKLMKKYYGACTDKNAIERDSISTLTSVLEKLGGWPVLKGENWNETDFNWITSAYKAKDLGLPFRQFLSVETINSFDGVGRKLYIRPPSQMRQISKAYNDPAKAKELYETLLGGMVDVAVALGGDGERAQIELRDSLQLGIDIYQIIANTSSRHEYFIPVHELERLLPTFPLLEYINIILAPDSKISLEDKLYYQNFAYLSALDNLLRKTSKRAQANYFVWMMILSTQKYLNERIHLSIMKHGSIWGDRKESQYRWAECVADIIANFKEGSTALYAKKWLKNDTRENIQAVLNNIKFALVNDTHEVEWFDKDLRNEVINEVLDAKVVVGFPDEVLSDGSMEEFYSDLEFDEDNYLQLYLNLTQFKTRSSFKMLDNEYARNFSWVEKIPEPYTRTDFRLSTKYLTISVKTLRAGDLFDSKYPNYLNHGAIGYWILQGIIHFSDQPPSDEYKDRYKCFMNQFGKIIHLTYHLVNFHISEECALNEAYLAYITLAKNNEPELLLPGLEHHTPEQLFWISLANSKCTKTRQKYEENFNLFNERMKNRDRINFAVKNSKYFGEIFKCPIGSMMNPVEKCTMY